MHSDASCHGSLVICFQSEPVLTLQTATVSLCVYLMPFWSVYSMNANISNMGQMKTVPKAKVRACAPVCV